MRILLLNQFFWPDSSATSQLLTDLSRALADRGHQVTAICSDKGGYASTDASDAPKVSVYRVKALRFARGTIGRILSYLTFYLAASWRGLTMSKQDLVLTLTTPPLLPLLGTLIKTLRGTRHFIWEMDMYPDVAVDLNYFKAGGALDHIIGALADYSRKNADGILALGECMADRLTTRGIPPSKIWIAHNWADGDAITPRIRPGNPEQLTLLYSGNIGLAHDFDTILASIEKLQNDRRFLFLFRGSGSRRKQLADFIERTGIESISLGTIVPRSTLSDSLSAGDIGLVTQREVCCGSVVPSKVYGLLAAGRPILFIGPRDATPARIIKDFRCGWQINPGDVESLTLLLQSLALNRNQVVEAGLRARQALLDHFDISHGITRILSILEDKASTQSMPQKAPSFVAPTPESMRQ